MVYFPGGKREEWGDVVDGLLLFLYTSPVELANGVSQTSAATFIKRSM